MELTVKQSQGLDLAVKRFLNKDKYTVISGFAGSGKSTLVKFIIAALAEYGVDPEEDVIFTSFTGKAVQVLQNKGNKNAMTLHKMLYKSTPKETGGYIRKMVPIGSLQYKVIVCDEVSMVPKTISDLLLRHNIYTIFLGDPFQLPPVNKDDDNHLLDTPHVFLDQVMRQAEESGIIRLSMKIRNKESIDFFDSNDAKIFAKGNLVTGMYDWADQILCATNNTRAGINMQMRQMCGFSGDPMSGDKVICSRNYWDISDDDDNALVNGTIGYLKDCSPAFLRIPPYIKPNVSSVQTLHGGIETETGTLFSNLEIDKNRIITENNTLDWKTSYKLGKNARTKHLVPLEFSYGYAITCHRAQGSEWDKVLIIEENFPFDREEHARWLYTAVTRGSSRVVLVR